jgi:chaperone modulatory protein CbpM
MISTTEFLVQARIDAQVLETWIDYGWLAARRDLRELSEVDLARVQLIRDLKDDMGVNDDGIAVILDLIDQIHGLRRTLRGLMGAVSSEPEEVQRRIAEACLPADLGNQP